MQLEDIKKLAELARIEMTDEEMIGMAHDFDLILAYVSQVQEIGKKINLDNEDRDVSSLKNVIRDDIIENETEVYTKKIFEQFPDNQDGYLKVKQIL